MPNSPTPEPRCPYGDPALRRSWAAKRKAIDDAAIDLARRRRELMAELDGVHDQAAELVPRAQALDGYPVTRLAALVGLTPQALYGLVRRRAT